MTLLAPPPAPASLVPTLRPQVDQHAAADEPAEGWSGTVAGDLTLVVAPSAGAFQPAAPDDPRGTLGYVTGGRGRADAVVAPCPLDLMGLMARPGEVVARGQALAWGRRLRR